jgi:hypothetical protein
MSKKCHGIKSLTYLGGELENEIVELCLEEATIFFMGEWLCHRCAHHRKHHDYDYDQCSECEENGG